MARGRPRSVDSGPPNRRPLRRLPFRRVTEAGDDVITIGPDVTVETLADSQVPTRDEEIELLVTVEVIAFVIVMVAFGVVAVIVIMVTFEVIGIILIMVPFGFVAVVLVMVTIEVITVILVMIAFGVIPTIFL